MDMATSVARRTRSRTLKLLLDRAKGIPSENHSQGPLNSKVEKKRTTMRDACSPPPLKTKRPRRGATEDDNAAFLSTNSEEGKREHEHVEDDNVCSAPVISPRLESRTDDRDRVSNTAVDDNNLRSEKKTSIFTPSVPVISESDDVISLDSGEEDSSEDDVSTDASDEVNGDYRDSGNSDDDDSDANAESDSSDYIVEASDSTFTESSESEYACSEDESKEVRVRDGAKGRKNGSNEVYTGEKLKTNHRTNNLNVFELLAKSIWERKEICKEDESVEADFREDAINRESSSKKVYKQRNRSINGESHSNVFRSLENSRRKKDDSFYGGGQTCDEQETRQFMKTDLPPLNQKFGYEEPEPIEKTEEEKELDRLWEEMAFSLTLEGLQSSTPAKNEAGFCSKGKHEFVLDEEIGLKCCYCSYVAVEIKDISPAMDKYHANFNDQKKCSDRKKDSLYNRLAFEAIDQSDCVGSSMNTEGTVWKYIPGIKDTLYPHQQEGFEFIWKNLVGTTKLDELESLGIRESGGCIISHSPGTGKTRLTIVFLQSFLKRFPDSHPVVIAPASLLLTWEEEFKKWNADIPFYNMNSLEFSGFEDPSALSILRGNRQHKHDKPSIRMVKLYSWRNRKSILGVSYPLYEKLAGKKSDRELQEFRRMLLELPGLLILDEGHTPRNQHSCIWKVLSEVKTEKRIILSGTPFQNNFKELSNVLCLARPAYTDMISSRLQELTKLGQEGKSGRFYEEIAIAELRDVIAPFVHVHKGNVLRENLPGLKDCVVVLNPPYQQKKILDRIDPTQTIFEFEHKHSAVSVHPSLFLSCNPTMKEKLIIGPTTMKLLERLRLDSKEGVKTRFVIDFIRFSESVQEKVLIFSQYIDTLKLIMEQLRAQFGWTEGEEIFLLYGQLEQKQRQWLINNFNKPDSKAKVLLASTRACSEGINLVGASRVILLDVVWNPSVESQAICRAYRIGQKRVVYTYHLLIKDTAEWDKYCKQSKKHRISELVFSSTNEKDKLKNNKVISEDRILDEMVRHEKLKEMFERLIYQPKESDVFASTL